MQEEKTRRENMKVKSSHCFVNYHFLNSSFKKISLLGIFSVKIVVFFWALWPQLMLIIILGIKTQYSNMHTETHTYTCTQLKIFIDNIYPYFTAWIPNFYHHILFYVCFINWFHESLLSCDLKFGNIVNGKYSGILRVVRNIYK